MDIIFFIFIVPSSPPSNIHVVNKTTDSISITWDEVPLNHSNGAIKGYIVFYKEKMRSLYNSMATLQKNIALFGLKFFTEYSIRVLAYTENGNGVSSHEISVLTSESGKMFSAINFPKT